MKYRIERPINGIGINGNETLLDGFGEPVLFDSYFDALDFIRINGMTIHDVFVVEACDGG